MKKNYFGFTGHNAGNSGTLRAFRKAALSIGLLLGVSANAQIVYSEPFTNSLNTCTAQGGSNGNWIFTNSCARSNLSNHTGPGSAFFQGSGCQYGNGSNTVWGELVTPSVSIGAFGGVLTFAYYLENECGNSGSTCSYDVLSVHLSTNNGSSYTQIMASNTGTFTNGNTWRTVTYNLPANQSVKLRFYFNSGDGWGNAYDGAYIDDIEILNIPACTASPAQNTIVPTTTLVCPVWGTSSLTTLNTYTQGGINYVWYQSTGGVLGPYTAIPNATMTAYTTPTLNTTTWYQLVATCQFGGVATTLTPVEIQVASTTTNNVYYFEGFEGITQNNQMPNCSWFRSDTYQCSSRTASVSTWRAARTGNKFAEFDASNYVYGNTRYFYSNGLLLNAGITYSASVWYNTPGYSTWYNVTLMYGPNQSPTGLVQLATIQYPNNSTYASLSNTFSVTTTGMYYMAVKATEYWYGSQLVWDDLEVMAPCQFPNNAANIALTGTSSICAGQTVNIAASGANSYTWSTNQNGSSISVSPGASTQYSVIGINPASGCTGVAYKQITVNQLPVISIITQNNPVCDGQNTSMMAFGASTFTWSGTGSNNAQINVVPTMGNSTYTVLGSDALGCMNAAVQTITVNATPAISVTGTTLICSGYAANLTASGAGANGNYQWMSNSIFLQGQTVSPAPLATTNFTVEGVDANECKGATQVVVAVDPCTGIENIGGTSAQLLVYPNPNSGKFTVVKANGIGKTIEVVDVTGRTVVNSTTGADSIDLNISDLANGVYYVKVKSDNATEVVKIVKH